MENNKYIALFELCENYKVESHFFEDLNSIGLIEIIQVNQTPCLLLEEIDRIEKIVRLHLDLSVNIEGIDVILNLLQKVDNLQEELTILRNRLEIYER